ETGFGGRTIVIAWNVPPRRPARPERSQGSLTSGCQVWLKPSARQPLVLGIGDEQLIEERSIVDERLPQILRAGLPMVVGHRDSVRGPVLVYQVWHIHRDIGRPLAKIRHRVASIAHETRQERIRLAYCIAGIVHEPTLNLAPG